MVSENIKVRRKAKRAVTTRICRETKCCRQTVSKWEQGISVPDADMLISLSEVFETPVSTLLGETVIETPAKPLRAIPEKIGGHQFAACKTEKCQRKNTFLDADLILCSHSSSCSRLVFSEKPLSGVGFKQSRIYCSRNGVSRIGMAVFQNSAGYLNCCIGRRFRDTKESVKPFYSNFMLCKNSRLCFRAAVSL